MSNTNDFSVAKVGDRVWSFIHGQGTVKQISLQGNFLTVTFDTTKEFVYRLDGKFIEEELQTLFWSKPEFIAPERPRRLVKKVVKVRPYRNKCIKGGFDLFVEPSMKEDPSFYGPEQDVTIEVWEE